MDDWDECSVPYSFLVDWDLTPYAGGESFVAAHRLYQAIDYFDAEPYIMHQCDGWGIAARLARMLLWEQPLHDLIIVVQHEVFGHGFRARSHGFSPNYDIDPPWPYGGGGGATSILMAEYLSLNLFEQASFHTGGVEANEVMATELMSKVFANGCMDFREATLYLASWHDQTEYLWTIRGLDEASDGHDMRDYTNKINTIYGPGALSYSDLKTWAWLNWVDPATFWSYWTIIRYIWCGERCQEIFAIDTDCVRFLPSLRQTLAPYGPEIGGMAHVVYDHNLYWGYIRFGDTDGNTSFNIGVRGYDIYGYGDWRIGGRVDLWTQPDMKSPNPMQPDTTWGINASVRGSYHFTECWLGTIEVGGKSDGFVPGYHTNADFTARVGISFLAT
jgi:hypothetical protein